MRNIFPHVNVDTKSNRTLIMIIIAVVCWVKESLERRTRKKEIKDIVMI